jgi:hypothetical protein
LRVDRALAVDSDVRDLQEPEGEFTDEEILETWLHAKEQGYVGSDARVPLRAFNYAAIKMGIATRDDIQDRTIVHGGEEKTLPNSLPVGKYNEAVEQFEGRYGVDPGRHTVVTEEAFTVDGLTTDETIAVFVDRYLTTEEPPEENKEYDNWRTPVGTIWSTYRKWCELNNVEHVPEERGSKKKIAEIANVKKRTMRWKREPHPISCYENLKLNEPGWDLYYF